MLQKQFNRPQHYHEFYSKSYGALPRRSFRRMPNGITPLWNNIQDNISNLKPDTSKMLKESGVKLNQVFQGVRTSFLSMSQVSLLIHIISQSLDLSTSRPSMGVSYTFTS